uniref:hypothetical protein n=1 Tax=Candidatus Electrothrix sp. TaxID=2170559 RepID=UPI004056802C
MSEVELPELTIGKYKQPDVTIQYGKNPEELIEAKKSGVLYQAKKDDFLFKLNTVGSYRVQDGTTITIERQAWATDEEIRLFLLGSAFGALIQQRGLLPFHSSTVVKDNEAYVIGGMSGAGKSSLAATLVRNGFALLADDISVFNFINNQPVVYPGIPHLKLWEDVLLELEEDISNFPKVRPQILKYRKPMVSEFLNAPIPLSKIIILRTKNTPGFEHLLIRGSEKFNVLKNNTYRYQYLEGLDKTANHFKLISSIADNCEVYRLERPSNPLRLNELAGYFIEHLI